LETKQSLSGKNRGAVLGNLVMELAEESSAAVFDNPSMVQRVAQLYDSNFILSFETMNINHLI